MHLPRPRVPLLVLIPALVASVYGWAVFASTFRHPGSIGLDYIAPGTDYMVMYGAIRLALSHQFALTLDGHGFTAYLNTSFADVLSKPLFFRPWVYPPGFLVLLLPFGVLGFLASYCAFQLLGAALLAAALLYRAEHPRAAPMIALGALACPAASINAVSGQCAFFVAAVLVLGIRLLRDRPLLAGLVLGLLSVKPQFALLVPIPLLAMGQWRGLLGAAVSALTLILVSTMLFGAEPWIWWIGQNLSHLGDTGSEWVTFGLLWGNSVYACAILLGVPAAVASLLQALAIVTAAACVWVAYRSHLGADLRLAVLLAAVILAAPHSATYDAILLTIAGMVWYAELPAPRPLHGIALLVLWLLPLVGPPALVPADRFLPLLILGFIALALSLSPRGRAEARPALAA